MLKKSERRKGKGAEEGRGEKGKERKEGRGKEDGRGLRMDDIEYVIVVPLLYSVCRMFVCMFGSSWQPSPLKKDICKTRALTRPIDSGRKI